MPIHTLKERTYLDAKGKATTDETKGVSLLGIENDEITVEQAHAAGLLKSAPEVKPLPEPEMLFYDAEGKRVKADDPAAALQFLDNDPTRPDAPKAAAESDDEEKPTKAQLLVRAAELGVEGVNKNTKNDDIAAAIAAEEKSAG